jgi:uncharacterized protein (TIGR03643 family)
MRKKLSEKEIEQFVLMAWADSVSFEAISQRFGVTHNEIVKLMRTHQSPTTYARWRERVAKKRRGSKSKHQTRSAITHVHQKLEV